LMPLVMLCCVMLMLPITIMSAAMLPEGKRAYLALSGLVVYIESASVAAWCMDTRGIGLTRKTCKRAELFLTTSAANSTREFCMHIHMACKT
jgi:hypothetical protein